MLTIGSLAWVSLAALVCALCASASRGDRALAPAADEEVAARRAGNGLLGELARHDRFTRAHSLRVARLADAVGRRMGLEASALEALTRAAALHDVGKLRVPDAILRKPGPLDAAEWALVAQHPRWGAELLEDVLDHGHAVAAVLSHHERFDGRGYPEGLEGSHIPLMARIVGACDAYDAMTSTRSYQRARSRAEALAELSRCSGSQFDPHVVEVLEEAVRAGADLAPSPPRRTRFRSRATARAAALHF